MLCSNNFSSEIISNLNTNPQIFRIVTNTWEMRFHSKLQDNQRTKYKTMSYPHHDAGTLRPKPSLTAF